MRILLSHARFAGPMVVIGGVLAAACVASTGAINDLQARLTRAVRSDAARMQAAEVLQIRLRQLRFHSVMSAADPTPARRALVDADRREAADAVAAARAECDAADDLRLLDAIDRGRLADEAEIGVDSATPPRPRSGNDLLAWADAHPTRDLLAPCRELADRQRDRMDAALGRSEAESVRAGRLLLGLGVTGAFAGVVSGYATAAALSRRVARLSVRVRAVRSELAQDVGSLTVDATRNFADLDTQLDEVVARVRDVCRRLQAQERDLLRAEQLAAVGQLAAGVAHEVRNPLTGMTFGGLTGFTVTLPARRDAPDEAPRRR